MSNSFPILEHEFVEKSKLEPTHIVKPRDTPEICVICFFREVIERVVTEKKARTLSSNRWEDDQHPIYEMEHAGRRVAFFHPGVGAPMAAGLLEEAIATGCRKFIVVGGAGALEKDLEVGKLILVSSALRDEGVSYHYLPPAREVTANPAGILALETVLQNKGIHYHKAKTWTTDAPYRETQPTIDARRTEGCFTVEMEAASLMAVAQFRGAVLGQLLYAGDDLSGAEWDERGWMARTDIREGLFWLAVEACLIL
jgi:uridine phosphorylase